MIETTNVTGTDSTGTENKDLVVTYFSTIAESMGNKFSASIYDKENKKFVLLFDNSSVNKSHPIDSTGAKVLIDTLFGVKASIIKASSINKHTLLRAITSANFQEQKICGFIITPVGFETSKWRLTYFENNNEVQLSPDVTSYLVNLIRGEMGVEPEKLPFSRVQFVNSLIPINKPPEPNSKFFILSTKSLLTVNDDPESTSELKFENGYMKVNEAPRTEEVEDGIYNNNSVYYEILNGVSTNISNKYHKVNSQLPLEGTVAEDGKAYIVGSKVYALNSTKVSYYNLNIVSNGTYPSTLRKNQFYKFIDTAVTDHNEITLNALYVCRDTTQPLEKIDEDRIVVLDNPPVLEIALEGEYYEVSGNVSKVVEGSYVDKGTVKEVTELPDLTKPMIKENTFYYVTTTKQLIYKIKDDNVVILNEGTDFTFTDKIPPYYDLSIPYPDPQSLYVLNFSDGDKPANSAWVFDMEKQEYVRLD